ncbi:MAG TPA: exodeoxyribonuclease VII small subunit [Thermomicrobiales bacterium]|nr:exodeoxyribonuclease VII small subunit [Thermomicrobiales bacterium]
MITPEEFEQSYGRWEASLDDGSFEEIFQALEEAVGCLESGHLSLERSIRCYEIAARLAGRCDHLLTDAELRVSRLDEAVAGTGRGIGHPGENDDDH